MLYCEFTKHTSDAKILIKEEEEEEKTRTFNGNNNLGSNHYGFLDNFFGLLLLLPAKISLSFRLCVFASLLFIFICGARWFLDRRLSHYSYNACIFFSDCFDRFLFLVFNSIHLLYLCRSPSVMLLHMLNVNALVKIIRLVLVCVHFYLIFESVCLIGCFWWLAD